MYRGIIKRLLNSGRIRNKYVVVYLLEYLNDYGVRGIIQGFARTVRQHGLRTFKDARRIIILKMQKRGRGDLPEYLPDVLSDAQIVQMKEKARSFGYRPKISFILPTYNTKPSLLALAVDSIRQQVYDHWEICIADDHSTRTDTLALLRSYIPDEKFRVAFLPANEGISESSNAAIGMATGEYIALIDHDDEITPDALFHIVKDLNEQGQADILYSDECKVDEKGDLSDYFFKPDWSPELLFNSMYTGHLTIYRKEFLTDHVGLFRREYDFSQDYDLMLRASEKTSRIRHIPKVLYHWRLTQGSASLGDKPYARRTNLAALRDAVKRRLLSADVAELPAANHVKMKIAPTPFVSIIIPSDSPDNLQAALQSIITETDYPHYEIVVVTNSVLIKALQGNYPDRSVVFVAYDQPYNFSDKCNHGAAGASGDILFFFNDDVRPLQRDWIENSIEYLFVPGVGGVSPKLIYENDTLQYAGMATGVRNLTGTTFHGYPKDSVSYINFPQLVRNVSILSGACLAIRKQFFLELGGFDAVHTPSAHSDTDLSFKILDKGFRCVYTPYASLRHIGHLSLKEHEKKVAPSRKDKSDIFLLKKWMKYLSEDPYFTRPMRNYLYHDSPEPFRLYPPSVPMVTGNGQDILVVSHDLSFSGAPISLFDTCRTLLACGHFVVVCSPIDGPMRKKYQEAGIPVIVDALVLLQHPTFYRFAKNFDHLFCNTIVSWPVVRQMKDTIHTLWWIQEAKILEQFTVDRDCEKTLREAPLVIGLSDYSLSFIRKYNPRAIKIYNACFDIYDPLAAAPGADPYGKVIFTLIGSLEERKGQDILIDALSHLEPRLMDKIEVRFIGRFHNPYYTRDLQRKSKNNPNVRFMGEFTHEQCLQLMRESDVIINASRDEPLSVAIVEAFCLAKTCIVSEYTGIAELITDGINGHIFKHADPVHLAEKISLVLSNTDKLSTTGAGAREIYKKHLTMSGFEKNIVNLLKTK
jgi:GT2 family glycosyltransferase